MLAPAGMLVQHAPPEPQQHEQSRRERRLDDDQRRQQERYDLQGEAEDRDAGAGQVARAFEQVAHQRYAQVLDVRSALGLHRLQGHP